MNRFSNKTIFSNFLWRFAERCGAQGVTFIVSVILARLLSPNEYGIIALISIFVSILDLFVDSGFGNALVQKKNADQLDYSTVFYFNAIVGFTLYGGMYLAAPFISSFYNRPELTIYVRVLSLSLIISGFSAIQHTIVSIRMEFKRFFFATLIGTIISAIVGIIMAYRGMGVWALIAQQLLNRTIDAAFLWLTVRWVPSFRFSISRLIPLFGYSSKLLLSALLNKLAQNITKLIIGKKYVATELVYYEKGDHLPQLVLNNLQVSVESILFPVFSRMQSERNEIKKIHRQYLLISSYLIFPAMIGMTACAHNLVLVLFTEKWSELTPYLQLCCLSYIPWMIHTGNLQIIKALGYSSTFLKLEIIKQIMTFAYLILVIPFGVKALLLAYVFDSFLCIFINAGPNKRIINYGPLEQLKDVFPIIVLSVVMGAAVLGIGRLSLSPFIMLILQVFTGVVVYVAGSFVLRLESLQMIMNTVKKIINK